MGDEADVDLGPLVARWTAELRRAAGVLDPAVLVARLGDAFRDSGMDPPDPGPVREAIDGMDPDARARLELLADGVRCAGVGDLLVRAARSRPADEIAQLAFVRVVGATGVLTRARLAASALRVEELARSWLAGLGVGVRGESPEQSLARLRRLAYGRTLDRIAIAEAAGRSRRDYLQAAMDFIEERDQEADS